MPRKQFRRKRSPRKPKSFLRKLGSAALPVITAAGVNLLKAKLGLNTETRYIDYNGGSAPATAFVSPPSSTLTPWSNGALWDTAYAGPTYISQGNGVHQRQGSSIRITRLRIKFRVQMDAIDSRTTKIKFMLTRVPKSTSTTPSVTSSQLLAQDSNYCSLRNVDETDYQIIWQSEKTFPTCHNIGVGTASLPALDFECDWKPSVKNGMLTWDQTDTTGAPANCSHGYLQMWYQCSNGNGNVSLETSTAGVNYYARLEYVDN